MSDKPSDGALPPGLDVLWGRRESGRRGPKPGLSLDAVVDAAMAVADERGLDAVSMANVAKALGFTTMSLYRYVKSKDELLALMWNASARGAEQLELTGTTWRERLRAWAVFQREWLDQHPWITEMPMATPPMAPNSLAFVERGLSTMDDTPLADVERLAVIGLISSYTISEARQAYDVRRAAQATPESPPPGVEEVLRLVVGAGTFPRLHRIAWAEEAAATPDPAATPDRVAIEMAAFLHGLELILDGVEATIVQRSGN